MAVSGIMSADVVYQRRLTLARSRVVQRGALHISQEAAGKGSICLLPGALLVFQEALPTRFPSYTFLLIVYIIQCVIDCFHMLLEL